VAGVCWNLERVWKNTGHIGELAIMVMAELVKSWKKFGRPQSLVDQNTKSTKKHQEVDSVDEVVGFFTGWLRETPSQLMVVMFTIGCMAWSNVSSLQFLIERDISSLIIEGIPLLIVGYIAVWPLFVAILLFPFKWDYLEVGLRRVVELNLMKINMLLLAASVVSLHVSLTNIFGIIAIAVVFGLIVGVACCTEHIRIGVECLGK